MVHPQLQMTFTDYAIIATVAVSAIGGLMRGLMRELVALVAWVLAVFVAWHFAPLLEPHLGGLMADDQVRPWAARALIFLAVLVVGSAVGALLGRLVRVSVLSSVDRFLGLLFGLARGVLIVGVAVIIGQVLRLEDEPWWTHSVLVPWGEDTAAVLRSLGGDALKHRRHAAPADGGT